MAELKVNFKVKKTVWYHIGPFLSLIGCVKFLEGKTLANLYVDKKFRGSIKFKISEYSK